MCLHKSRVSVSAPVRCLSVPIDDTNGAIYNWGFWCDYGGNDDVPHRMRMSRREQLHIFMKKNQVGNHYASWNPVAKGYPSSLELLIGDNLQHASIEKCASNQTTEDE